ncbi:type I-C CRISPR-associated protein Cas7/Csd2 [Endozoicomonas sp. Mp262]|uniref:type I-C CRISPR-associated protein Cas7/Csd2 n=1 Tax=Endozoicomonas sp. Mp262 TaxID=2919499 RepID=UPI0021DF9E05
MSLQNRYEFVLLFDVKDGNPNGDPDAGNLPRVDPETGQGLVTDVCLKRKIRNFVGLVKGEEPPYEIYVKEKAVLNHQHARAYEDTDLQKRWEEAQSLKKPGKKATDAEKRQYQSAQEFIARAEDIAKDWVCHNFYDVRTFGAVMSTSDSSKDTSNLKKKAGQVRGAVQMNFSRSIDPIVTAEHSLTVVAARKGDKPIESQIGIQGRKYTVPYGLYRCHGYISAHLAQQTRFGEEDLELFLTALEQMFDHDHSASRGEMATRALLVFKHDNALGNAPAHKLFDCVRVEKKETASGLPARSINDYALTIKDSEMPQGVELIKRVIW